jgi:uncharacterized protein
MASEEIPTPLTSFLGTGWSFPPEFITNGDAPTARGEVRMLADEADIASSLRVLFGTQPGERDFNPAYGVDVRSVLFEPMSTTLRSFLSERIKLAVLFYEPRINVRSITILSGGEGGSLQISLDYEIRATNSRFNLVFPFYRGDGNEARIAVGVPPA